MDAHENARKGAVTAVLKSALRGYGEQFGNSLYGDGTKTQQASRPATVEQLKHINAFCERLNRPRATSATLTLTSCCMNSCKPTILRPRNQHRRSARAWVGPGRASPRLEEHTCRAADNQDICMACLCLRIQAHPRKLYPSNFTTSIRET